MERRFDASLAAKLFVVAASKGKPAPTRGGAPVNACDNHNAEIGHFFMKTIVAAIVLLVASLGAAHAQSDMSCADLIKANAQIDAATKAEMAKDATAAALDTKINAYCAKNPTAKASEAMEKAMQ